MDNKIYKVENVIDGRVVCKDRVFDTYYVRQKNETYKELVDFETEDYWMAELVLADIKKSWDVDGWKIIVKGIRP